MSAVEITVRGSHTVRVPPQRATVHATVAMEGPSAEPVFEAVTARLAEVVASLEALRHPKRGPVTRYAVEQVRRGSHRPWNTEGKQLPLVHTAALSVAATFRDFAELAAWVGWSAGVDGLSVDHVDWTLRESRRRKLERATRQQAVRDARRRAQDYADALDLGAVSVRTISDPGLGPPVPVARLAAMSAGGRAPAPEFVLRPEDVEISAHVEAGFVISRRP